MHVENILNGATVVLYLPVTYRSKSPKGSSSELLKQQLGKGKISTIDLLRELHHISDTCLAPLVELSMEGRACQSENGMGVLMHLMLT